MSLISRMRRQKAVYWAKTGSDKSGQPIFAAPVEIKCRWEDAAVEFLDTQGRTVVSNAVVYVDRSTPPGGALWKGTLATVEYQTAPYKNDGAYEIRQFDSMPNFKATESLLTAYL